jgi:hypothetical protein
MDVEEVRTFVKVADAGYSPPAVKEERQIRSQLWTAVRRQSRHQNGYGCLIPNRAAVSDQTGVTAAVVGHTPDATVIVLPRSTAAPSAMANTDPTPRDWHLQHIAEHRRMAWQKYSRYNVRALVEAFFSRWKRIIGGSLRFRTEDRRSAEIAIAVWILNRMLDLGRPESVCVA